MPHSTRRAPEGAPIPATSRHSRWLFLPLAWLALIDDAPAQWVEPDARQLTSAHGTTPGDLFGWRVRRVDDVNGDGVQDFAVAAPFYLGNQGRMAMHSGKDGKLLWSSASATASAVLGFSLESVDDLDSDGTRDVLVGEPFGQWSPGFVHAYSGKTGRWIRTLAGKSRFDSFGFSIATDGDFDGDGVHDIAIAATSFDVRGNTNAGRVYIYSSKKFALITTIDSNGTEVDFGTGVAFIGDVNGDKRDDLAVVSRLVLNQPAGMVYVFTFDGKKTSLRRTIRGIDAGGALDGDYLGGGGDVNGDGVPDIYLGEGAVSRARVFSGANGSTIHTFSDAGGDRFGHGGVGIVRDLNDDGYADVLVGARWSSRGANLGGRVFLYSGRDGRLLQTITSRSAGRSAGSDADLLGDVNGDGTPDYVIGAVGRGQAGAAFVVSGRSCLAGRRRYGRGLAGTRGTPKLGTDVDPVAGSAIRLELTSSARTNTIALLTAGARKAATPLPWGGLLLLQQAVSVVLPLPPSGTKLPLKIPASLCTEVFCQGFLLDSGASGGVAQTAGLELSIGR